MKILLITLFMLLSGVSVLAQTENPEYRKNLADSLGADDYGMRMYVFVILKVGPSKNLNKAASDSLFHEHLQNIKRLANEGKIVVAGPMLKNDKNYEGIFILNARTLSEAHEILDTDPALRSELLEAELYGWYGSAALPLYLKYHNYIKKKNF